MHLSKFSEKKGLGRLFAAAFLYVCAAKRKGNSARGEKIPRSTRCCPHTGTGAILTPALDVRSGLR
ncbi:MAG TPA: hypothetical protein VGA87_00175, partial [Pyrinomonadaceae bacterium]